MIGATHAQVLVNLLWCSIPAQIAQRAEVTVIMVKRRLHPIRSFLRQTIAITEG